MVLLARALDKTQFDITIAAMYPGGAWWSDAAAIEGVSVRCLRKGGRYDVLPFGVRLARLVQEAQPHVVQTHGVSAIFGLAAAALGRCGLILGIRNAHTDLSRYGWLEPRVFAADRYVSRLADLLIANSHAGKAHYASHGYPAEKIQVVPNGFDTDAFRPCRALGGTLREQWGIADDHILIGIVARIDPVKDHETFLRAASHVARVDDRVRFAVIGDGTVEEITRLKSLAESLSIGDRVVWAGMCHDMLAAHNTLDVCVSTSLSEGISNSIGEAMSCGVPCIVTDVGDSALLVDDPSRVTPPAQPEAASQAWLRLVALSPEARAALGQSDRRRIVETFSLDIAARRFQTYIEQTADRPREAA
jgi:glycosyltransferase involved in cell wall biosynthesis